MDTQNPTPLENIAKTIFRKVLSPSLTSRNTGKVAICCFDFYSRFKTGEAAKHKDVISARAFCLQYEIKTEMDFVDHCKSKDLKFDPRMNSGQCRIRDEEKSLLETVNELKADLAKIKAELEENRKVLAGFPVDFCEPDQ